MTVYNKHLNELKLFSDTDIISLVSNNPDLHQFKIIFTNPKNDKTLEYLVSLNTQSGSIVTNCRHTCWHNKSIACKCILLTLNHFKEHSDFSELSGIFDFHLRNRYNTPHALDFDPTKPAELEPDVTTPQESEAGSIAPTSPIPLPEQLDQFEPVIELEAANHSNPIQFDQPEETEEVLSLSTHLPGSPVDAPVIGEPLECEVLDPCLQIQETVVDIPNPTQQRKRGRFDNDDDPYADWSKEQCVERILELENVLRNIRLAANSVN